MSNQLFYIFFLTLLFTQIFGESGDNVVVNTLNGPVLGVESTTYFQHRTFYAFRGIPYAVPPLGNLRFKASLPAKNWTSVYNATYARSACTQTTNNNTVTGSEDCLFLSIYTTKLPSKGDTEKLSVIFWIHGGAFVTFFGDLFLHGADRFLNNNTIVVGINYRLGIFGFLSTLDSASPGNYGLKDAILALEWVQKNIAFFGGDPNSVTIMGESAGAALVHDLILSQRAKGLFHRGIAESGDSLTPWSQPYKPRDLAFKVGVLNGILTLDSEVLVKGLQKVDANKLQQSLNFPSLLSVFTLTNGLLFAPVIEKPSAEAVLTQYCYEQLLSGNFSQVPFLHGFNSMETKSIPWYANIIFFPSNVIPGDLTPDDMHANFIGKQEAGLEIKNFYFDNGPVVVDENFINYTSDDLFVRGTTKAARLQSKHCQFYLYRFAFIGGKNHRDFDPDGAEHAEEVQFLFLFIEDVPGIINSTLQTTPEAILTAVRMVELWTNFAKTGNPTPNLDQYVNVTWPTVNSGASDDLYYLNIDTVLEVRKNPEKRRMQFWDNLYNKYGIPPYNTY